MALKDKMLSITMVANQTGLSSSWIRILCTSGRINAVKHGHDWIIPVTELKKIVRKKPLKKPKE